MGISSGGFGRPFPLGPALVQTRTTCQGQPGAACPLSSASEATSGRSAPLPARPRAGARCGTAYPLGGPGSYEASGRSAPGAPPTRRGSPFLPRNGEKEGRGQAPWTPSFMARLLPLAHFGGRAALSRSWGYFSAHLRTLIWRLSFIKCFFSIFFTRKCVPNRS